MKIIHSARQMRRALASSYQRDRIALVPTMGCLHEGHVSLIRKAKELADIVVVSIFVNPLQFGPDEDLNRYPRTFESDAACCRREGVDFIFAPENLYPENGPKVSLHVETLGDCLCGRSRPGHFNGVATAVNALFNVVHPDLAVFGEKDWQQLAIIRRMVDDLSMPVEIVGVPTVREADGLAMSSRNRYLDNHDRNIAGGLYASLNTVREAAARGEANSGELERAGCDRLKEAGIEPEYLEIRHADTLARVHNVSGAQARAFVAATIGGARLIDNIPLENI